MAKTTIRQYEPQPANLSATQMKAAIPVLERRIKELEAFDPQSVQDRRDCRITTLEAAIDETLVDTFGSNTIDYRRYERAKLIDRAGHNIYGVPLHEIHEGLVRGKEEAIAMLRHIIKSFGEKLGDMGETAAGRALQAYSGMDLHGEIERAAGKLYRGGHYGNAVQDAVKALNGLVRLRSQVEQDGSTLMERVFNPTNPVLKFNELKDQNDRDERRGYMMLFSGAVVGLRNPRAHRFVQDDPEQALEFIAFVSLLAKLLDSAQPV